MTEPTPNAFEEFPKLARLSREAIITEKIDGTNAQIYVGEDGTILAGSRTRWITRGNDNAGFAGWVEDRTDMVRQLGPGRHFGEWWGSGIQRGYGYDKGMKFFSLFNVQRWCEYGKEPQRIPMADPRVEKFQEVLPAGFRLVPILDRGLFSMDDVEIALESLKTNGSVAAPGFMDPEGVVVWHTAANRGFKKTLKDDGRPKSLVK